MKRAAVMSLLVLAMVGCSSTPSRALNREELEQFGRSTFLIEKCAEEGMMDTRTAAKGMNILKKQYSRFNDAESHVRAESYYVRQNYKEGSITDAVCRLNAVKINQIDDEAPTPTQAIPNINQPTNTYCNKIGTQVFCRSF